VYSKGGCGCRSRKILLDARRPSVNECCDARFVLSQCNNPKTKEPKLAAAMRIIPEWKDRDAEIRRLWDRVYSGDQQASSVSSSDSNIHSTTTPSKCVLC